LPAKEIADTVRSVVIKSLSSAAADRVVVRLTDAGATARSELVNGAADIRSL